ncbi:tyrosine-type recombinase/integrase [Ramlibacter sp. MAHUQ-53]|uniref:tyrosine-type recombinase/integrase n=1 Tax=unclassified Ramlibacter TaxID=2617605 RepID=UPI0036336605
MHQAPKKSIDLAAALQAVCVAPAAQLSLAELLNAYNVARGGEDLLRLRKWIDAFGTRSAWSITAEELEAAAQAMIEHGYAPATANRDLSALGSAYRWARTKRLTPRGFKSPTLGVRRFEEPVRRVHIKAEDLERLKVRALAYPDRRFGAFVSLLIETGARKSELLERRWTDVDLAKGEILAPMTKNGTPRVLFFSDATRQLLQRLWPNPKAADLLFEGRVPGQPISFRKAWSIVTRDVGLPQLRMHDIRHAAAANLLRSGVTLGVAAQVLGHDPAVLARRYGHLETASLRRAQEQAWSQTTAN